LRWFLFGVDARHMKKSAQDLYCWAEVTPLPIQAQYPGRSVYERAKIPVSRQERNALVNAALGDQRIPESRLAPL
jgi:hypothetical protein